MDKMIIKYFGSERLKTIPLKTLGIAIVCLFFITGLSANAATISGNVTYSFGGGGGDKNLIIWGSMDPAFPVHDQLFSLPVAQGTNLSIIYDLSISTPGRYFLYYFIDLDGDGFPGLGEPFAYQGYNNTGGFNEQIVLNLEAETPGIIIDNVDVTLQPATLDPDYAGVYHRRRASETDNFLVAYYSPYAPFTLIDSLMVTGDGLSGSGPVDIRGGAGSDGWHEYWYQIPETSFNGGSMPSGENTYTIRAESNGNLWEQSYTIDINLAFPLASLIDPLEGAVVGTTPTFQWDSVSGALRYRLDIYDEDDNWIYLYWMDSSTLDHTLSEGIISADINNYKWRINAYDTSEGSYSNRSTSDFLRFSVVSIPGVSLNETFRFRSMDDDLIVDDLADVFVHVRNGFWLYRPHGWNTHIQDFSINFWPFQPVENVVMNNTYVVGGDFFEDNIPPDYAQDVNTSNAYYEWNGLPDLDQNTEDYGLLAYESQPSMRSIPAEIHRIVDIPSGTETWTQRVTYSVRIFDSDIYRIDLDIYPIDDQFAEVEFVGQGLDENDQPVNEQCFAFGTCRRGINNPGFGTEYVYKKDLVITPRNNDGNAITYMPQTRLRIRYHNDVYEYWLVDNNLHVRDLSESGIGEVEIIPGNQVQWDDSYLEKQVRFEVRQDVKVEEANAERPIIVSFTPDNEDTGVDVTSSIQVEFSESMKTDSMGFYLRDQWGNVISDNRNGLDGGIFSWEANGEGNENGRVIFTPSDQLKPGTAYEAWAWGRDAAETSMLANQLSNSWWFTTAPTGGDVVSPKVISTMPLNNATGVRTTPARVEEALFIAVQFSEPIDPDSLAVPGNVLLDLNDGADWVNVPQVYITYAGTGVAILPLNPVGPPWKVGALLPGTLYRVTLKGNIVDLTGNLLGPDYTWEFTTGPADNTGPTMSSPLDTATDVNVWTSALYFYPSEELDRTTLIPGNITIEDNDSTDITDWFDIYYRIPSRGVRLMRNATMRPSRLKYNETYTVTFKSGVQDLSGNPLQGAPVSFTFTTVASEGNARPDLYRIPHEVLPVSYPFIHTEADGLYLDVELRTNDTNQWWPGEDVEYLAVELTIDGLTRHLEDLGNRSDWLYVTPDGEYEPISPGDYSMTMTVTDSADHQAGLSHPVTVFDQVPQLVTPAEDAAAPLPPTLSWIWSPSPGPVVEAYGIEVLESAAPDAAILARFLVVDDGRTDAYELTLPSDLPWSSHQSYAWRVAAFKNLSDSLASWGSALSETRTFQSDSDNDGVADGDDDDPFNSNICSDTDGDNCDDCTNGVYDPANDGLDTDSDGFCNAGDDDDDNDGVADIDDSDPLDANLCSDTDGDTCEDCLYGTYDPDNDGTDTDYDGLCDAGDDDDDNDGLTDDDEINIHGTNPLNPDHDGDGLGDGAEVNIYGTDPLTYNTDTDNDDLLDSVETGTGEYVDENNTGTFFNDEDSDNDGLNDGEEVHVYLTDPNNPDHDGDTIIDGDDAFPLDISEWADFDTDGIGDNADNCPNDYNEGQEDLDEDGIGNVCDQDADGDTYISPYFPEGNDCNDLDPNIYPGDGTCEDVGLKGRPPKNNEPPDTDGDTIYDTDDNCPSIANTDQSDRENNEIGDGIGDVCDNCPDLINPDQQIPVYYKDIDGDGYSDGETLTQCSQPVNYISGPTAFDCDDSDPAVNPDPETTEIANNGIDDDCDPGTPDIVEDYTFVPVLQGASYDDWLPIDGQQVVVDFIVKGPDGNEVPGVSISLTPGPVTSYPGKYINDSNQAGPDFDVNVSGPNQVTLIPRDYGGSIVIHAEATVTTGDGTQVPLQKDVRFPKDIDSDGMADAWESIRGLDLTVDDSNSDPDGDGLTNFKEYRGVIWGRLNSVAPNGIYETVAFIPDNLVTHIRTDPNRRDLFVQFIGFDAAHPFAIGEAYQNAGIDVYALDQNVVSSAGLSDSFNIHVVTVTLADTTFGFESGHIMKRGVMDYTFATLGLSSFGNFETYGSNCTIYKTSIDYYFSDRPYKDYTTLVGENMRNQNSWGPKNGTLDMMPNVEDKDDDGKKDGGEDKSGNGILDGDHIVRAPSGSASPWEFNHDLSPFNIDNDSNPVLVELPVTDTDSEFTKAQVIKHVVTHEIGHNVGINIHTEDPLCVMYKFSQDWLRDTNFSNAAKELIMIHNN